MGNSSAEMAIKRDQERARLLAESGWTQQELALRLGRSQRWISYQLLFGRFLNSSTIVLNIREGAFRSVWEQTDSNDDEAERFAEALELLEQQATDRTAKPSRILGDRIMARFADGEWHALDAIAAGLGVGQAEAKATLEQMRLRGAYRSKCEHKQVGLRWHYRIFRQDKLVSTAELIEKLGPIVDELLRQGQTNAATVSIGTVGSCGAQIKRLLDEWSK